MKQSAETIAERRARLSLPKALAASKKARAVWWRECNSDLSCASCGRPHGHHPDYSRPLDVVWLCDKHHKEVHAMARQAA